MPKGIHDSSSDKGLIHGHEIQFRIHAPEDYSGNVHLDAAKGLMINTVEQASFNSIPEYNQRIQLSDGTIIVARLTYGVQRVDIYPVFEKGGVGKALYVLRPKNGYPKAIIYEDTRTVDGVSMVWGDNIYAGGNYSNHPNEGDGLLISTEKVFHRAYTDRSTDLWRLITNDGPCGGVAGERRAYVKGQTLLKFTSPHIIGGTIVTYEITDGTVVSMYCFVRYDSFSREIRFYSHPLVTIPDEPTEPQNPIIDEVDLILVHTITLTTYDAVSDSTNNAEVTTCTFNSSGTTGFFVQTGRNDLGSVSTEQTEHTLTLTISDDPTPALVVVDSSVVYERYGNKATTSLPDPAVLPYSSSQTLFTNADSMGVDRSSGYTQVTYAGRFHADTFTGGQSVTSTTAANAYRYAMAMNGAGTAVSCSYTQTGSATGRYVNNILYDGAGYALSVGGGTPQLITSFDAAAAAFPSVARGADPTAIAKRYRTTAYSTQTISYDSGWGSVSATQVSDTNVDVLDATYLREISPTYTPTQIYVPSGPYEATGPVNLNATDVLVAPTFYGNYFSSSTVDKTHRIQVGVRESMSISLRREDELPARTFTYDSGTNTYVWGAEPEVLYKQTLTFESINGAVPIPGLADDVAGVTNGFTNSYSKDPRSAINLSYSPPTSSAIGVGDNYAPFRPPSVDAPFLPHPEGYCLYSLTDFCMDVMRDGQNLDARSSTVVVGLYIEKTDTFVDILAMYNDMIANDGILSARLAPVSSELSFLTTDVKLYAYGEYPAVGQGSLMYYAGLLDEIHEPTIDYSDYI